MARKISRKGLIKQLDKLVTEILLKKEKACVICGSTKQLGNSHIFSRRNLSTRWDITPSGNCHINCWACNYNHMYNTYPYNKWYIKKYGQKKFDELYQRWNSVSHFKDYDLIELRDRLKKL